MTIMENTRCVQQQNNRIENSETGDFASGLSVQSEYTDPSSMLLEAARSPEINENAKSDSEDPPSISELLCLWKDKRGKDSGYFKNSSGGTASFLDTLDAVYPLLDPHLDRPLCDFRKAHLVEIRDELIEGGKSVATINKYICAIKTIFRFGSERICRRTDEEYVDLETMTKIDQIKPLKKGENNVKIRGKVRAVPRELILKVAHGLKSPHREIVIILLITGMRSGELLGMKPSEIDYETYAYKGIWMYTPKMHKTAEEGKERLIPLNREVQEMLKREIPDPEKNPDLPYFHHTLRGEVRGYGQKSMNTTIKAKARALGFKTFNLHQIRHTFMTEVQDSHSLEAAAFLAGNSPEVARKFYAEAPIAKLISTANDRTVNPVIESHSEDEAQDISSEADEGQITIESNGKANVPGKEQFMQSMMQMMMEYMKSA